LFGNLFAEIDIPFVSGLSYRVNYGQNINLTRNYSYDPYGSNFDGSGAKSYYYRYEYTLDNIITYKKQFGLHNVNATLVYGLEKRSYDATAASAEKFTNKVLGYNYLQAGQADLQRVSSNAWEEASIYSMGRLFYGFNNRYMFTGTVRRDGFSGFGANHKFGIFPSASIAWVISEEGFVKDKTETINNLKLRLSYGASGNRAVSRYQTLAQVNAGNRYLYGDNAQAETAQYLGTLANKDLKWEKTTTLNAGLDFSLLDSRLSGSMDVYTGKSNDMLYQINIPQLNGFGSVWTNIGEMSNRGQELTLTALPVKGKEWEWEVTFNYSRNRNKVVTILGRDDDHDGKEDNLLSGGRSGSIFIGEPYGVWYDFNIIGMWQLADDRPAGFDFGTYKVEDIDGDGKITAAGDRKLIGYQDPSYRFSVQTALRYRRFELKAFVNSIQGGDNYYLGRSIAGLPNPDNATKQNFPDFGWWMPERPDAKYRRLGAVPAAIGEDTSPYTSRSFVRLQDVTLSYTFSPRLLSRAGMKMLKIYVSGKNLATWTKWDSWDPETGESLFSGAFPVMRNYSVGLNLEF
jgi:TonB-linked SusC/RagA family outer membrane protein